MLKLNVGSGNHPLRGWVNIDNDPAAPADHYVTVPPIPYGDGEVDQIYAGHFLEHLTREEANEFMKECYRVLKLGGKLGIVVPDLREVMKRYMDPGAHAVVEYPMGTFRDMHDMDDVCDMFIFSTVQASHHKWHYDFRTLARLMVRHGFNTVTVINPWMDPRVSVGSWYQFGAEAVKA